MAFYELSCIIIIDMIEENKNCWLTENCSRVDCDGFCLRRFKLDYLYNQSLLSVSQRKRVNFVLDKDESDKENFEYLSYIDANILGFINHGGSLLITSPITGNGKTAWSVRMIQSYFDKIWLKTELSCKALFINVPRYLLAIKDNISEKSDYVQHIKQNVLDADLVVWDEVGTKGLTQFEHENILNIINARVDAGKANIYTSNLNNEELREALGDRLYSRVVTMSEVVTLEGADKRSLL